MNNVYLKLQSRFLFFKTKNKTKFTVKYKAEREEEKLRDEICDKKNMRSLCLGQMHIAQEAVTQVTITVMICDLRKNFNSKIILRSGCLVMVEGW